MCLPGESVTVTVCGTEDETAALLAAVLDGDRTAAALLARAIHQDPATIDAHTDGLSVPLSPSELGIWIDPIGERLGFFLAADSSCRELNTNVCPSLGSVLQMLPASTSRAERRCWRRVSCLPRVCTVRWF